MALEPTLPAGSSPAIQALLESLNVDYSLAMNKTVPVEMPESLPLAPSFPLILIEEQLASLDVIAASLSSHQSFKEGMTKDQPVPGAATVTVTTVSMTPFK